MLGVSTPGVDFLKSTSNVFPSVWKTFLAYFDGIGKTGVTTPGVDFLKSAPMCSQGFESDSCRIVFASARQASIF
jgi:hypothetical protein